MSVKRLLTFLKLAVSLALIVWLLRKTDLASAWGQVRAVGAVDFWGLLGSVLLMNAGQVARWYCLVRPIAAGPLFWTLARFHMIAVFFQSFLPSSMAVEVVKGYQLSRKMDPKEAYGSVVFGKVLGFAVLFLIVAGAAIFRADLIFHQRFTRSLLAGVLLFTVPLALLFSKKASRILSRPLTGLPGAGLLPKVKEFRDRMYAYRYRGWALAGAVFFSVLIYLGSILASYFSFRAVSLHVPFVYCMLYMPLVFTLMLLPVSINGIGLREGLILFFFQGVGLTREALISSSALVYAVIYGFCLVGGGIYFLSQMKGAGREVHP